MTSRIPRAKSVGGALLLALALAAPVPALADDRAPGGNSPDELAREGIGKIISALEMLMMTIPTYEMPEILPNGDIIIRRRDSGGQEGPEADDEADDEPKPI